MNRLRLLPLALMALLPAPAFAQEVALQPVIAAALDHGSKVAHADVKVSQAQGQAEQAAGAFDWRANARAGWARLYYPRVQTVGGVQVLSYDLQSSWNPEVTTGVSKLFRNGIQIQPGITFYPSAPAPSQACRPSGLTCPVPSVNSPGADHPGIVRQQHVQRPMNAPASGWKLDGAEKGTRRGPATGGDTKRTQTYWKCLAATEEESVLSANRQAVLSLPGRRTQADGRRPGHLARPGTDAFQPGRTGCRSSIWRARKKPIVARRWPPCRNAIPTSPSPHWRPPFRNMDQMTGLVAALHETPLVKQALRNRPRPAGFAAIHHWCPGKTAGGPQ